MRHFIRILVTITAISTNLSATLASVKSLGMAAAVVANPMDSLVIAYNPAGITWVGNRIDVGFTPVYSVGKATITGNTFPFADINKTYSNHLKWVFNPEGGFTYKVCDWLSLGAAVYNEKELHTDYDEPLAILGTSDVGAQFIQEVVAPTIAFNLGWGQSVGISLDWTIQRLKATGLEGLAHPLLPIEFTTDPDKVTNNHYNYSQGWGVKFGYLGCFRYFSVGASYKPKTKMAKFSQYKGFIAEEGSIDVPPMYRVGIAFYPLCGVTVAADFQYIEYSRIPALNNPFVPNIFTYLLGSADGAGFDWSDQRFWRFGINWDINCDWSVRAGYRTANVPFDKPDGNVLTLDTTVDFVVVGGSWRCLDGAEISAFVGHGFNRKISGELPPFPTFGGKTTIEQNRTAIGVAFGWCY